MKQLLISAFTGSLILCCSPVAAQDKEKIKDDKVKIKDDKIKVNDDKMKDQSLPYTANYSSNFSIGKAAYSKIILDLWKDWDDNAFERHDYMADSITMIMSNGQKAKGKNEVLEGAKKIRGSMTSATSTVDVWIPLRSNDKGEDWVAIWGQEEDVYADGKKEKREIHEVWRFNKDGKVDYMEQYTRSSADPIK